MQISARIAYSLMALMELSGARQRGTSLRLNEIATRQEIPDRYLEHILTSLRQRGIVQSQRGIKGGYMLAKDPRQITVLEIIQLLESEESTANGESRSNHQSNLERQILQEVWQEAGSASQSILGSYTLEDLCQKRDYRLQTDPMYYI